MENYNNKKMLPLQILSILKEHSDQDHHITQAQIKEYLKKEGFTCDRKTISRNISLLIEYGFNIIRISGGGCFYVDDTFDNSEITFLVDCVYSSPAISQYQANSLIKRLIKNVSAENKKKFENIFKTDEIVRTDNKQIFLNIELINEAIANKKQISFKYNQYNKDKVLIPRKDKRYILNPFFTINSRGKYFLVCNKDNYDDISNYRIDYMTDIEILDTNRKPISKIKDGNQIKNPTKYANEHIYMFSGETKIFKLKLYDEKFINEVIDWFGKDIETIEENGILYVNVKTNENAIVFWALQYGKYAEIVEPESTRQEIKTLLKDMSKRYNE